MEPVSYSKIRDKAATLQGRVQSAPLEGAVTSSKFVHSKKHVWTILCVQNYLYCTYIIVVNVWNSPQLYGQADILAVCSGKIVQRHTRHSFYKKWQFWLETLSRTTCRQINQIKFRCTH